jgi:outer membrane protein, heavy metal efflux system
MYEEGDLSSIGKILRMNKVPKMRGMFFAALIALLWVVIAKAGETLDLPPARLEDLLEEAEHHNPEIQATLVQWHAAEQGIALAWVLPDPMVGMDLMGADTETRVGPQEGRFMASQAIPFPLKLLERKRAAEAAAREAHEEHLAMRREVLTRVRHAFYELYAVDASIKTIEEIHRILQAVQGVAQARYAQRSVDQRDVAKAQAEVSLTLEQLYVLKQERISLTSRLNALLNRSLMADYGIAQKPPIPVSRRDLSQLLVLAENHRERIKAAQARLEKSLHQTQLARLEMMPDLQAAFQYTWVGSGMTSSEEDGRDSWMFPLQINVPLWPNRILPGIREAKQKEQAARHLLQSAKNETAYEVRDAFARYDTAGQILRLYETAVIPQALLALKSDQAGYESGLRDFLNLLDSERVYLGAQLSQIRIYTQALKGHADLFRAAGLDDTQDTQ